MGDPRCRKVVLFHLEEKGSQRTQLLHLYSAQTEVVFLRFWLGSHLPLQRILVLLVAEDHPAQQLGERGRVLLCVTRTRLGRQMPLSSLFPSTLPLT